MAYVEVAGRGKTFRPRAIEGKTGQVADESYILSNDARFAFFGLQSVMDGFICRDLASARHTLTVTLEKKTE